jgi:hypothetical protein
MASSQEMSGSGGGSWNMFAMWRRLRLRRRRRWSRVERDGQGTKKIMSSLVVTWWTKGAGLFMEEGT